MEKTCTDTGTFSRICCISADSHIPCRSSAATLPLPCHSPTVPNTGRLPTCHLWTVDANSHIPRRSPAVALRGRFQNGIFVAWQGNGMACVYQTRPHCVNQMGKTQSKPLAERHGMCESVVIPPRRLLRAERFVVSPLEAWMSSLSNLSAVFNKIGYR
jgi:hypothetical protein